MPEITGRLICVACLWIQINEGGGRELSGRRRAVSSRRSARQGPQRPRCDAPRTDVFILLLPSQTNTLKVLYMMLSIIIVIRGPPTHKYSHAARLYIHKITRFCFHKRVVIGPRCRIA